MKLNFLKKYPGWLIMSFILLASCLNNNTRSKNEYEDYLNRSYLAQLDSDFYKRLKIYFKRGVSIDEVRISTDKKIINPLIYSIKKQRFDTTRFLLDNNAKVTYIDEYGNNALMWAIYNSDWDIAIELIDKGSDVNIVNKVGDTPFDRNYNNPLDYAARNRASYDFFKYLFDHGAKISKRTLNYAIDKGCSYTVIKLLLEKTIESKYKVELSPFKRAVILNDEKYVKKYIEDKDDDDKGIEEIKSMMSCIASLGYINLLKLVKENGYSLSIKDDLGKSLIQYASQHEEVETVKYLIENGVAIDNEKQTADDLSPLDYVIKRNNKELVRLLASHKAISFQEDIYQFAALYADVEMLKLLKSLGYKFKYDKIFEGKIVKNKNCISIIQFLIENGYDINKYNKIKGASLLYTSLYYSIDYKVTKWLIDNGANPKTYERTGTNPVNLVIEYGSYEKLAYLLDHGGVIDNKSLFQAVWSSDIDAIKLLVKYGVKLSLKYKGNNVLHEAAYKGYEDIIEYLVSKGMKINEPNDNGDTPLHIACKENKFEAVKKLIELKADTSIKNKDGETAYEVAKYKCDNFIIEYFDNLKNK